jgi:hypothetical protein
MPSTRSLARAMVALLAAAAAVSGAGPADAAAPPAGRAAAHVRDALPAPLPCAGCWTPSLDTSWQWQLQGRVDLSFGVEMYDVDGFEATSGLVDDIHAAGAAAVCYVDVGSWERWRPDAGAFPRRVLGARDGWAGERWLDIRATSVLLPIMRDRLDMCRGKGFDGVELDLVDGYANRTGLPLTARDQLEYDMRLANAAHARGMSVALKNDLGQIRTLLPYFDYALNEQCHQYRECGALDAFVQGGKAVFGVEYRLRRPQFCPEANAHDFNFLRKDLDLRARPRVPCRGV